MYDAAHCSSAFMFFTEIHQTVKSADSYRQISSIWSKDISHLFSNTGQLFSQLYATLVTAASFCRYCNVDKVEITLPVLCKTCSTVDDRHSPKLKTTA